MELPQATGSNLKFAGSAKHCFASLFLSGSLPFLCQSFEVDFAGGGALEFSLAAAGATVDGDGFNLAALFLIPTLLLPGGPELWLAAILAGKQDIPIILGNDG